MLGDDRHHVIDAVVLDPEHDRGVRLLEEATGRVEPCRAVVLLEESVDQGPGILVVDDREDQLHEREYMAGRIALRAVDRLFH